MNTFKIFFCLTIGLLALQSVAQSPEKWELKSPDGQLIFSVSAQKSGSQTNTLQYEVFSLKNGKRTVIIEPSPLGLNRQDQSFSQNLAFVSKSPVKTIDEKYKMLIGRQLENRNHARELSLTFKNPKGALIQLVLRAYNDGVAFKYVFPGKSATTYTITEELTGFNLPDQGKTWIEPHDKPGKYTPAYELYYENGIAIGTPSPHTEGWAFPALFQANNSWILISEANLTDNYCGVRLEQNAPKGLYKIRFPEPADGKGTGQVHPKYTLPWSMPWRTIIIGSTLATVVESQMIHNLSDAPKGDFSWVKPGRSSWGWQTDHDSPQNYEALKKFVDLSAELNWEYSLVDANWDLMKGGDITQLIKYAQSKKVDILMWYNSGGPHNEVTERPRDVMFDPIARKAEFKKLRAWGVKGVKIDFWQSDKQNLIKLYLDVLKDAAAEHILVNFHGCTIPRGWSRTYPNLISLESVRGEENYAFDGEYPVKAPVQNSILAFTRNVIGPMDYTPVTLSNLKYPHLTTFAHELALTVVFNSGILHFGDNAETYRSLPDYVKTFMKNVPATFDETRFISGEPGKSVVIASRKGKTWYVAGINSEKTAQIIKLDLPLLGKNSYQVNIINDGPDGKSFQSESKTYTSNQPLPVNMSGYGGFVATITIP